MKDDFIYVPHKRWQEPVVKHALVSLVSLSFVCDSFSSRSSYTGASCPVNIGGDSAGRGSREDPVCRKSLAGVSSSASSVDAGSGRGV